MPKYTLFADRDSARSLVARNVTRSQAAELADRDDWPEGHDALIAGADGEFYLADEWEPLT